MTESVTTKNEKTQVGEDSAPYLLVNSGDEGGKDSPLAQIKRGFEDQIGTYGAASLALSRSELEDLLVLNPLQSFPGVFEPFDTIPPSFFKGIQPNRVRFQSDSVVPTECDVVRVDAVSTGDAATRHLHHHGHKIIGFVGFSSEVAVGTVSRELEAGWRRAVQDLGLTSEGLSYSGQVPASLTPSDQIAVGQTGWEFLITKSRVTGIVVANLFIADGIKAAVKAAGLPVEKWPAVVCCDGTPDSWTPVVACMETPWEEIGRSAAEILFGRCNRKISGSARIKLVLARVHSLLEESWRHNLQVFPFDTFYLSLLSAYIGYFYVQTLLFPLAWFLFMSCVSALGPIFSRKCPVSWSRSTYPIFFAQLAFNAAMMLPVLVLHILWPFRPLAIHLKMGIAGVHVIHIY